jgi:hypothetical protein
VVLEKDREDELDGSGEDEEILRSHGAKEYRAQNKKRKANWIRQGLCRNSLLKFVIEGKMAVTGRRRRRYKQLLDGVIEKKRYWDLKGEALDLTVWRTRLGRLCEPVVRQTM